MVNIDDVKAALVSGIDTNFMKAFLDKDDATLADAMTAVLNAASTNKRREVAERIVSKLRVVFGITAERYIKALHVAFKQYPMLYINAFIKERHGLINSVVKTNNVDNATAMLIFLSEHSATVAQCLRLMSTKENPDAIIVLGVFLDALIHVCDLALLNHKKEGEIILNDLVDGIAKQLEKVQMNGWDYKMPMKLSSRLLKLFSLATPPSLKQNPNTFLVLSKVFELTKLGDIKDLSYYLYGFRLLDSTFFGIDQKIDNLLKKHAEQLILLVGILLSEQSNHFAQDVRTRLVISLEYMALKSDVALPESVKAFLNKQTTDLPVTQGSSCEEEVYEYLEAYIAMIDKERKNMTVTLAKNVRVGCFELDALITVKIGEITKMLNVEVDGAPFHSGQIARVKNNVRDSDLNKMPEQYSVVRLPVADGRINYKDFRDAFDAMVSSFPRATTSLHTVMYQKNPAPTEHTSSSALQLK